MNDPDLEDLAVRSKVQKAYAEGYMTGRQVERQKSEHRLARNTFPESLQKVDWGGVIRAAGKIIPMVAVLLAPMLMRAQVSLTVTGPSTVTAGNSVTVNFSVSGSSGTNLAGLQLALSLPTGSSYGVPVLSPAWSVAPNSTLQCYSGPVVAGGTPNMCIGYSFTLTPMADGSVGSVPISIPSSTPPGNFTVALGNMLAASTSAAAISVASGNPYVLKILSRCDINGDGALSVVDVQTMTNQALGQSSCSVAGVSCNVVAVEMVQLAVLGQSCKL